MAIFIIILGGEGFCVCSFLNRCRFTSLQYQCVFLRYLLQLGRLEEAITEFSGIAKIAVSSSNVPVVVGAGIGKSFV